MVLAEFIFTWLVLNNNHSLSLIVETKFNIFGKQKQTYKIYV
jgi:hypothetical protein